MCGVAPGQLCTFDGDGQTLPRTHCYQATSDTISWGHFIRASRDSGRPAVRRSAPPLYCAMREGMLELTVAVHRWRFTSSIPPAHKEGGGRGCFLSRTCIATRWRLRTRLRWLGVFLTKRLISLCCASRISADANECLLWSDCSARRRAVRQALAFAPWAICEELRSHCDSLCPGSSWGGSGQTQGQNPELSCRDKAGLFFFFLLLFCVTDHRTAIYFNDVNEQCCRVGLLERFLILPGGNRKHQGWPPQPALWKRQCSSLFTFVPV